jgi:hypothetical protein
VFWWIAAIAAVLLVVLIAVVLFSAGVVKSTNGNDSAAKLTVPSAAPVVAATCPNSWPMSTTVHLKNRWFAEGIASINDAKTNVDAVAAAPDFAEKVSQEATLLVGAAKAFHLPDVDVATLTDSKGCATDATVKLKTALDVAIATAHSITLGEAPVNGTNTGVENGKVVSDVGGTIGGNRKAIQIVLSDGTTIWIMARCGNIVTSGPPIFPPGKTDNPPVCVYNHALPPDSPECLAPKVGSTDVGANSKVDPFKQDGGEKHTVSNGNGATVANGNQGSASDVAAAQKAAADKAAADAAAAKAAQDAAIQAANQSGGGQVSTDQNQGSSGGQPDW